MSEPRVLIEAFATEFPPCGLREFITQLGCGINSRAPHQSLRFNFLVPRGMGGCFGRNVEYTELPHMAKLPLLHIPMLRADLFHAPHQLCRFKWLKGVGRTLMTVHDINFVHTRTGHGLKRASNRFEGRQAHADALSFISEYAREDVMRHFPCTLPSRVIYNGVSGPGTVTEPVAGVPEGGFLFHLSSLWPYKNAELLVEMMKLLPHRTLVMAGGWKSNPELLRKATAQPNVIVVPTLSDPQKWWLYEHCDAFLFPSKAEGFGLPPIEAMKCGKPVFLSTLTSLPEIGGDAAFYWPDLTPQAMAAVLEEKLSGPIDTAALLRHAARFTWDRCVDSYIDYYHHLLKC